MITLRASQIVSGLALTIFAGAAGLSSYLASDLDLAESPARHAFSPFLPEGLQDLPVIGPLLFAQTALVYGSWVLTVAVALYLSRTRPGLELRAVGEAPGAADAVGINVSAYRYVHTLVGGALAGVGGACFSLSITPQWLDGLTGGAGWIAIALVIFAFWRPGLCLVGAYVFGAFSALPFTLQARGVTVAPELFQALPYVMTVVVLVAVSTGAVKRHLGAPAALGTAVRPRGALSRLGVAAKAALRSRLRERRALRSAEERERLGAALGDARRRARAGPDRRVRRASAASRTRCRCWPRCTRAACACSCRSCATTSTSSGPTATAIRASLVAGPARRAASARPVARPGGHRRRGARAGARARRGRSRPPARPGRRLLRPRARRARARRCSPWCSTTS